MKKITKAVFPVGGMGTRFLPATKSIPKEMLPIIDKPLIQYAVEEAIAAGITTLIFITSGSKHAISDHFDPKPLLREKFVKEGKQHLLEKLNTIPNHITRVFVPQGEPKGFGHAVLQAKELVGDDYFAVILADDYIKSKNNVTKQLIEAHLDKQASVILVEEVEDSRIPQYGIVDNNNSQDDVSCINSVVEKPTLEEAPSNLGIVGRYILSPRVFDLLEKTKPDSGGEIQLTDALAGLLDKPNSFYACKLNGDRFDCGHKLGYIQATIDAAFEDKKISNEINDFVSKKIRNINNANKE